jgi:drug/metabolite transporter (DMT)-like permease
MTQTPQNPILAAALTVLASAFVAATTLLAKALGTGTLGPELHPLQITQGRFLFAFMAFSMVILWVRPQINRVHWRLHIGRSTLGGGGITLMFAAATFIPLSDATAISFLNPVFGMMLAIPFLGEKVGPWRWLSALIALSGALILMRPGADAIQTGALVALAAALVLGAELIFVKLLTSREPPLQILFINNAIGLVLASTAASFFWQWPTAPQWAALAAIGLLMAAAQTCFINAMKLADASFVSPFFYTTLAFATLYDATIFGVLPDLVSWSGMGIILIGAIVLAWRETRAKRAV